MGEISLCVMTRELCRQFFRAHESDPAVYADESRFRPYVYSDEAADSFYERRQVPGRLELVAMMDGRTIGQVQLKNIDTEKRECELGFHMQNDSVKGLGYGTRIARLALEYAFENLEVDAVYANTILKNTRSQHVLEKVGFRYISTKDEWKYYRCGRDNSAVRIGGTHDTVHHYRHMRSRKVNDQG